MKQIIVLLPSLNEEDGIGEVIDRIKKINIDSERYLLKILVVDGNSTDSTRKISKEKGAEVLLQSAEGGKGIGVREAIGHILKESKDDGNDDLMIMMDADATYYPEDLPRFIEMLENNDVVWGSRLRGKIEKKAMSKVNKFGNMILSLTASIVFMKRTTDLCTGYWGFRLSSLKEIALTADGFNLEADLFSSVVKKKLKTKEIPINYAHREGFSTLKWYKDGPRIFAMVFKKRFK